MLIPDFSQFPVLETDRLKLRRLISKDADGLFEIRSDEKQMEFLARPIARSVEDANAWIEKIDRSLEMNDGITWGICLKDDEHRLIGTIGFWRLEKENYRGEIGYILHRSMQGRGLMQEAIEKVIDFGFKNLELHSIEADINPANGPSIKLVERNGFKREGTFKDRIFFNNKFIDMVIFSKINPEPLNDLS
jgi:ribosomal-protein-alanine N-acetyltransferase